MTLASPHVLIADEDGFNHYTVLTWSKITAANDINVLQTIHNQVNRSSEEKRSNMRPLAN